MVNKLKGKRSYLGQPFYGSNKTVRIFKSVSAAEKALKRKKASGEISQIGPASQKIFIARKKSGAYLK